MLHFRCIYDMDSIIGRLLYVRNEYSFDFLSTNTVKFREMLGDQGTISILVNTLQLEVDVATRRILYPWGYYPDRTWLMGSLPIPEAPMSGLLVDIDEDFVSGISIPYKSGKQWITTFDPRTGWIRISNGDDAMDGHTAAFASNVVAYVREGHLASLWLHPEFQ